MPSLLKTLLGYQLRFEQQILSERKKKQQNNNSNPIFLNSYQIATLYSSDGCFITRASEAGSPTNRSGSNKTQGQG